MWSMYMVTETQQRLFCSVSIVSVSVAEDLNWNALEWDRAAEELTWERVGIFFLIFFFFIPLSRPL